MLCEDMNIEQSPVKKFESALDDFLDLWRRRKIVCCIVLVVIVLPTLYTTYQQLVAVPKLKDQVSILKTEKSEAEKERDKAELQLAPFLAVADSRFPDTPSDQRLDLLLNRIDKAITDAFRYNLPPEKTEGSAALFAAVKFFLDDLEPHGQDVRWHYRRLVVSATKGLSTSVIPLLKAHRFQDFLKSVGVKVETMSFAERKKRKAPWPSTGQVLAACNGPCLGAGSASDLHYVLYPNLELWIDERVLRALERVHFDLKKMYTEIVRDAINATQSNE